MWNYKEVYMPSHPKARPNGCVLEHRLVAEKIVGRVLKDEEVVHHIDEDRSNNDIDNLIVFKSQDDHARFHLTGEMIKGEDNTYYSPPITISCKHCGNVFESKSVDRIFCSNKCHNLNSRKTERPSREELLNLISEETFVSIGERYGVSDNAVRKWCKSYGLPYRKKDIKKMLTNA